MSLKMACTSPFLLALPWMATPPAVIGFASCLATPPAVIGLASCLVLMLDGPACNLLKREEAVRSSF